MADIHTRWKPDFDVYDRLKEQGDRSRRQASHHFGPARTAHLLVDLHAVRAGVFIGDG